jgi:DNA polymerase III subunit chi
LERAVEGRQRVVVVAGSEERVDYLDNLLWVYDEGSFLPHGAARDGNADRQPIWLTAEDENPNAAGLVMLIDGARADLSRYARACDIFDGNDEAAVAAARRRWVEAKAAGHAVTYWQQTDRGWEKKVEA